MHIKNDTEFHSPMKWVGEIVLEKLCGNRHFHILLAGPGATVKTL